MDKIEDEIVAVKPPTAAIAAVALEQTAGQKQVSVDNEGPSDTIPNIESFDVSEEPNATLKSRTKLRTYSIIFMLCVRLFPLRPH